MSPISIYVIELGTSSDGILYVDLMRKAFLRQCAIRSSPITSSASLASRVDADTGHSTRAEDLIAKTFDIGYGFDRAINALCASRG